MTDLTRPEVLDAINESTRILKAHNDRYCRHGVEFWCWSCNERANAERVAKLIKEGCEMSNMSYCRFHNTYIDLLDCIACWYDIIESEEEKKYRDKLLALCKRIAADYEDTK